MNKRRVGRYFEEIAIKYLRRNSYNIITKNFYYVGGEIDIIAHRGGELVFIEVKYRSNDRYGSAIESIDYKKLNKIKKGISYFLYLNSLTDVNIAIELFLIDENKIEVIRLD